MLQLAVDVGGTFTDCLVWDSGRDMQACKAPTTPADPAGGVVEVLRRAAESRGGTLGDLLGVADVLVHGTTLATNALLTGGGATVGLVTTAGFRDVVEARRGMKNVRTSMYDVQVPPYRPLVPRRRRLPVRERTAPDGTVLVPLDEADLRSQLERLGREGVGAVAVCYLHSYANADHETRSTALAREVLGEAVHVAASSEVLPVCGEYERFSTTVVSACVGPVVARYLLDLEGRLRDLGFRGQLLIVKSDGLVTSPSRCSRRAADLIRSGPAAAPTAALHWARGGEVRPVISTDMGGTSFDVCLVPGTDVPTTTEAWVGDERVALKMVDVVSIGSGGGSVAHLDELGLLRVGPRSAGAVPGPACYGRGGTEATVTDADLLLGYIPPDGILGGALRLDAGAAQDAVARLGAAHGWGAVEAAEAIYATVNQAMADAVAEVSTRRGLDVRDFDLVAGGGAGPVHAVALAELLGADHVIVPRFAGLFSSYGMFAMDLGREYVRGCVARRDQLDLARLAALFADMEAEARGDLGPAAVRAGEVTLLRSADFRYAGQFHEVEVALPAAPGTAADVEAAVVAFHRLHRERYRFDAPLREVELVAARLRAVVRRPALPAPSDDGGSGVQAAAARCRPCRFGGRWVETPCYASQGLPAGGWLQGPAVIEEPSTTVVVPPGFRCHVLPSRAYRIERG